MEQIKWEDIYECWKSGSYDFPNTLTVPISAETVLVEYNQTGYIYGYDWLRNSQVQKRKQLISEKPLEFLYFTAPSNKGTIQTAEMLAESQNDEERAAIWIAATAKELSADRYYRRTSVGHYADMLHISACGFLQTRYYLWHHAMKKLVPEIMIPQSVLEDMNCKTVEPLVGLMQMNTYLLQNTWSILRYSSLKDGASPEYSCRLDQEE